MYFDKAKTLANFGYFLAHLYELLQSDERDTRERAAARVSAGLAAVEQAALDGGRWDFAQMLLPMPEPPFSTHHGRAPPRGTLLAHAKLADPALVQAAVAHLKDMGQITKMREEAARHNS